MGTIAFQITSLTIAYSTAYSGTDQREHQSSTSLAICAGNLPWPVNSPHKWPVTQKMFPFDDVIISQWAFKMKITQSRPSQMITFTMTIHGIVYVQELPIPFTYSCQLDFIHIFEEIHINTRVASAQPWKIGLNKFHESTNKLWYKQTIKPNITDISYGIYFVSTMDWMMINYWQHTVYVQEFIKSSHFERHQCSIFYKIFFIFCTILWMNKTCA